MEQQPLHKEDLSEEGYHWQTESSKDKVKKTIKAGRMMERDRDKKRRVASKECIRCYYNGQIFGGLAGAAISWRECTGSDCKNTVHSGNTSVDKFCGQCSDRFNICVCCGSKLYDWFEL